jgi:ABC-2 type transport system permease protein
VAVYKRGYERYQGPTTGHLARLLALPRYSWRRQLRQPIMIVTLALAFVWPLLCAAFIYVANHSSLWAGLAPKLATILTVNSKFFLIFMDTQAVFCVILAALAGPGLIAPDLANNALPLYFSRPLTRLDYVGARLATLMGILALVTWVPGLLLFAMQVGMGGTAWFKSYWTLGGGLFLGFLLWSAIVSLVALASSAYVKWRLVAGGLILGFFFVTSGVGAMVNSIFRVEWGSLANPSKMAYTVWCALLGAEAPSGPDLYEAIMALAALVALLGVVLERKLRPVEVVR